MNTIYNNGKTKWEHGRVVEWHENGVARRSLLGPCPNCGSPTSTYGGGFSCHNDYCPCSASNFACSAGPMPDWWNTGVQVYMDGDMWCAVGPDFIDLQVSIAGFGKNPSEAVKNLRVAIPFNTLQPE